MGYKVYWNDGAGAANTLLKADLDVITQFSTSSVVADLSDGVDYRFKLVAFNAVGDGAFSELLSIVAATVPAAPSAPTLLSQSDEAISIQWSASPASANGGSPILDYHVYYDNALGGSFTELASTTTPNFSYTLTTVTSGKSYRFKITAINVVGESLLSPEVALIASSLPGTPGTPTKVSADDSPQITVTWTAPTYDGGSDLVSYRIYMNNTHVGSTGAL